MVDAKQALSRQPGLLSLVLPVIMCYDMMKKKTLQAPGGLTSEHVNATSANPMGQRKFYHRV